MKMRRLTSSSLAALAAGRACRLFAGTLTVLVELCFHTIVSANIGSYRTSEWEVCQGLLPSLTLGMLCIIDRGLMVTAIGNKHTRLVP